MPSRIRTRITGINFGDLLEETATGTVYRVEGLIEHQGTWRLSQMPGYKSHLARTADEVRKGFVKIDSM